MIKLTTILKEIQIQTKIPLQFIKKDKWMSNKYHYIFKPFEKIDWFNAMDRSENEVLRSNFLSNDDLKNLKIFLDNKKIEYNPLYGAGLNWIEIPNYKKYFSNFK